MGCSHDDHLYPVTQTPGAVPTSVGNTHDRSTQKTQDEGTPHVSGAHASWTLGAAVVVRHGITRSDDADGTMRAAARGADGSDDTDTPGDGYSGVF